MLVKIISRPLSPCLAIVCKCMCRYRNENNDKRANELPPRRPDEPRGELALLQRQRGLQDALRALRHRAQLPVSRRQSRRLAHELGHLPQKLHRTGKKRATIKDEQRVYAFMLWLEFDVSRQLSISRGAWVWPPRSRATMGRAHWAGARELLLKLCWPGT